MDIGALVILNWLSVPFIHEIEDRIKTKSKEPLFKIVFLRSFRNQRWRWGYFIILLLFTALSLTPTKPHPINRKALLTVAVVQAVIWIFIAIRARQSRIHN